ncbi:MAG: hypothetical protein ABIO02_03810 [Patescibacteria group bacterium]
MFIEDQERYKEFRLSQHTPENLIPRERIDGLLESLSSLKGIELPGNKSEVGIFKKGLRNAMCGNPISIYIGSCPDYSQTNGKYNHRSLGEEVPLLSKLHLESSLDALKIMDNFDVKYEMILMVADVEAIDEYFAERFTGGSEDEFIRRCEVSREKTSEAIEELKAKHDISGIVRSSSFFQEFGRTEFLRNMYSYQDALYRYYEQDPSFHFRVATDTLYRRELYQKMYPERFLSRSDKEKKEPTFLEERTMRTMAQYLALGKLISEKTGNNAIINHPTVNKPVYNSRNVLRLLDDDPKKIHPTIPILQMTTSVY